MWSENWGPAYHLRSGDRRELLLAVGISSGAQRLELKRGRRGFSSPFSAPRGTFGLKGRLRKYRTARSISLRPAYLSSGGFETAEHLDSGPGLAVLSLTRKKEKKKKEKEGKKKKKEKKKKKKKEKKKKNKPFAYCWP